MRSTSACGAAVEPQLRRFRSYLSSALLWIEAYLLRIKHPWQSVGVLLGPRGGSRGTSLAIPKKQLSHACNVSAAATRTAAETLEALWSGAAAPWSDPPRSYRGSISHLGLRGSNYCNNSVTLQREAAEDGSLLWTGYTL